MDASSPPPPKPSKESSTFGLGRRIRELHVDITGILYGPSLSLNFLASDVVGFFLYVVLANDWSAVCREKFFASVPLSRSISESLSRFWNAFRQERWQKEDAAEERMNKWCPHLYKSSPPRLRSYHEILNRQQALRNCCSAQLQGLETRDVARNMLLQAALALCWVWSLLKDHITLIWLLAAIENKCEGYREKVETSIPPAFREKEATMPVTPSDRSHCCLRRIQRQISRGHDLVGKFVELGMCELGTDDVWDETEWLSEKDGEIPADLQAEDQFLVDRVVFSAGLSWLMVSISCDFATFYLLILMLRFKGYLVEWF